MNRCGKCDNCRKLDRIRSRVLACCNPPFSHIDKNDGVVEVWNDAVRDFPCTKGKEES